MNWAQIVLLLWLGASLGAYLVKHGQPKTGNYNAGWAVFSVALELTLLYFGGFFSK